MTVLLGLGQSTPPILSKSTNDLSKFCLEQHLQESGVHTCQDGSLFRHVNFMESTLFEILCPPGSVVFVNTRENGIRPARIKSSIGDNLYIEYLGTDVVDREWITISDLVLDVKQIEYANRDHLRCHAPLPKLVNIDNLQKYRTKLDYQIFELIQINQYFELQDEVNPAYVYICEVIRNYGGLVIFKAACSGKTETVNITSNRCHAVGWVGTQIEKVSYFPYFDDQLLELALANPVPSVVFESSSTEVHNFKEYMLLEVLDPLLNEVHVSHISRLINDHYFEVSTGLHNTGIPSKIICHRGSPTIFPFGYNYGEAVTIRTPSFLACEAKYVTYGSDEHAVMCQMYMEYFRIKTMILAPTSLFGSRQSISKISRFRYLELFCPKHRVMRVALIVNVSKDFLHLLPEDEKNPANICKVHLGSLLAFPAGFHQLYGLPLIAESNETVFDLHLNKCKHAVFSQVTTSRMVPTPQPIFRKRSKRSLRFVPDIYLKSSLMVPSLRTNKHCLLGRWFLLSRFRALQSTYSGGPLPIVIEHLVKDLFRCVVDEKRNSFVNLFQTTDELPLVLVKHKWRTEHILMRIPICENSAQFCNWLKCFLRFLGCCPNLINVSNFTNECDTVCTCLAQNDNSFIDLLRKYMVQQLEVNVNDSAIV